MLSYFINLVLTDVSKETLILSSIFGYIFFFLFFNGNSKWNDFSEVDKIFFSLVFGFSTFYLLLLPIYNILTIIYNFIYFTGEQGIINPLPNESIYKMGFVVLTGYLLGARKELKKPLFESKTFHVNLIIFMQNLCTLICFLILFFVPVCLVQEYSNYFGVIFSQLSVGLVKIVFLWWLYLAIFIESSKTKIYKGTYLFKKLKRATIVKKIMFVGVFILFIIISPVALTPTIEENSQKIELSVKEFPIYHPIQHISAEKRIYQDYTVKPPIAINWIRVNTNYEVLRAYSKTAGNKVDYFVKNNYFIVNETNKTNVTAVLIDEITFSNEVYLETHLPEYKNETEKCDIYIMNNFSGDLKLNYIELYLDRNYKPVEVITTYNKHGREYSYFWRENNSSFDGLVRLKGDFIYIYCEDLKQNESVDISAVVKVL